MKKFFKKLFNDFRLSRLLLKRETKKIIFLCIAFLITCFTAIIVSSISLDLDKAINFDETKISNKVIRFDKDNLDQGVLNYATTYSDNTIVKQSRLKTITDENNEQVTFKVYSGEEMVKFNTIDSLVVIDTRYDTYDKYDEKNVNSLPLPNTDELSMVINTNKPIDSTTKKRIEFVYNGTSYSHEINLISGVTANNYISLSFYDYFKTIFTDISIERTNYSFSFASVLDAANFYNEMVEIDTTISNIHFTGVGISNVVKITKQVSLIICVIAIITLLVLLVCFLNLLIILFIDKQKNIGLLKAQGLTNTRISFALLARISFALALSSIIACGASYLLMPILSDVFTDAFFGQFFTDLVMKVNVWYAVFIPIGAYLLIIIPSIIYIVVKCKIQAINLIRG